MFTSYESLPTVSGDVISYGKYETPHASNFSYKYPVTAEELLMNRDAGAWDPEAGLVVGDGVGLEKGADMASHSVVTSIIMRASLLRLGEMTDETEAVEAVREDILPFADRILQRNKLRYNLPNAKTLASSVLHTQKHTIVHWTGDVRVHEYLPGDAGFRQLTHDQYVVDKNGQNLVSNYFEGSGRNHTGNPMYDDQIIARPRVPGARYLAFTDGFYGNLPHQAIPDEMLDQYGLASQSPQEIVRRLAMLPLELLEQEARIEVERGIMCYRPRHDDMTIGASLVG